MARLPFGLCIMLSLGPFMRYGSTVGGRFRASKGHRPARAKLLGLFTRYGFPSGWPLSRVESGAKPPGESQRGLSPGPPRASVRLCERLQCGAALVAEDSLNFRLCGRNPLQNRRTGSFASCTAAAWGWRVCSLGGMSAADGGEVLAKFT